MTGIEIVVCIAFDHRAAADGLARFKQCLARCPRVASTLEVTGTFDLIVEARCDTLPDYLSELERMRPVLAEYATRVESSFVCRKLQQTAADDQDHAIWLACEDGRRRVPLEMIDKVIAEGDYMRVHVGDWSTLVHQTLCRMAEQLSPGRFLKLHRSCLVRLGFIDRLIHEGRRWRARLRDGSEVTIAQSSVHEVLRATNGESSMPGPGSSKKTESILLSK